MHSRYLKLCVVVLMAAALGYGCEANTSYRVLSFFFDGVPPPKEATSAEGKETGEGAQSRKVYIQHGPYAAKQCESCHFRGSNKLVAPIEELCFRCHTVDVKKKYIHGPLASGGCKVCHEPHGSNYPFLLVAEPKEFCLYCHDRNAILKREVHSGMEEAQCTMCHDAHSSDKEYLLK